MKKIISVIIVALSVYSLNAKEYTLLSPNGNTLLKVDIEENIQWSASCGDDKIIEPSEISIAFENKIIGKNPKLKKVSRSFVNEVIDAKIYKRNKVEDIYNQILFTFNDYALCFRVYDDGIAYRWSTNFKGKQNVIVVNEQADFNFPGKEQSAVIGYVRASEKDVYYQSFENEYTFSSLKEMSDFWPAFAPIMIGLDNGYKVVLTDADVMDYPGMFLKKSGDAKLSGNYAPFVLEEKQGGHNNLQSFVTKRADYIARVSPKRDYPWRAVIIAREDKELLDNNMVYKLASPCELEDISWIKPGKLAWDYWCDWNISGVDFKSGINTDTYKFFIDFASKNGIEYVLLDEGWAESTDIMKVVPSIDLEEIIDYGKRKNVSILLWGGWVPLDQKMDKALKHYSEMGIKGFKVDFMDRDDQRVVDFCTRLAKEAAKYKLLIDYHGCYKPTGLQRTYPNVINFEGVYGLEYLKGDYPDMPRNDATIPFLRMLAGPVDYTQGAMVNNNKKNYKGMWSTPMSQGTRAHQVALYVVFESPLVMLADSPNNYMKEQETTDYITGIPTIFDQTEALAGKVGEYAAIARKKGDTWYVGAITDWNERELLLDFSFLSQGLWKAEIFMDGVNADRNGNDYKIAGQNIVSGQKIKIKLAPGGGWTAKLTRVN